MSEPERLMTASACIAKVVIDTQTWIDLLHFGDPRCEPLAGALQARRVTAFRDDATKRELIRVLGYAPFALSDTARAALLQRFMALSHDWSPSVDGSAARLPRCRDPDDQMFLELAHRSGVDVLISRDKALLALDRRCRKLGFAVLRADDAQLLNRLPLG
ncbi:MAG: putative toxin-antitoxin system toxin component, PIN family [Xanthomonadales bacterium]|nr:putative toxin-antitoxin system toxin component, PIN family [Xanthomonadales bacterium]